MCFYVIIVCVNLSNCKELLRRGRYLLGGIWFYNSELFKYFCCCTTGRYSIFLYIFYTEFRDFIIFVIFLYRFILILLLIKIHCRIKSPVSLFINVVTYNLFYLYNPLLSSSSLCLYFFFYFIFFSIINKICFINSYTKINASIETYLYNIIIKYLHKFYIFISIIDAQLKEIFFY